MCWEDGMLHCHVKCLYFVCCAYWSPAYNDADAEFVRQNFHFWVLLSYHYVYHCCGNSIDEIGKYTKHTRTHIHRVNLPVSFAIENTKQTITIKVKKQKHNGIIIGA